MGVFLLARVFNPFPLDGARVFSPSPLMGEG